MNLRALPVLLLGTALSGTAATSMDFEAAHLDFSYSSLRNQADGRRLGFNAGAEYVAAPNWNIQANSGVNFYNGEDDLQGDVSGHLIYTPLETVAVGGYLGYEGFQGFDTFFGGIEARVDIGDLTFQGYYQIGDSDGTELNTWGTNARYAISPGFNLSLFFDNAEFPGAIDYDRYGVGVDYRFDNQFAIFAKAGVVDYSERSGTNDTDFGYIEIGGRYIFGGNGQTTFDKRSVFGVAQGNYSPNIPD